MRRNDVGNALIVGDRGEIRGIVTERDMVVRALAAGLDAGTPVEKIMSRGVESVYGHADVFVAATEMAEKRIKRMPVLDDEGHPTGIITFDDLIETLSSQLERLASVSRRGYRPESL